MEFVFGKELIYYKYAPFGKTKPPENLQSQKLVVFH